MALIRIDINGEVLEETTDKPAEKAPERRRDAPEITDLQIVEIEQVPETEIPPFLIPGVSKIIEGNRERVKKELPN